MAEIYELVRALRGAVLPRNRNFDAYASAAGKRARRIHRFLLSVEKDLARAESVTATEGADGALELTLMLPSLGLRRTVQLDRHARTLLLESTQAQERLAAVVPRLLPRVA